MTLPFFARTVMVSWTEFPNLFVKPSHHSGGKENMRESQGVWPLMSKWGSMDNWIRHLIRLMLTTIGKTSEKRNLDANVCLCSAT